MFIPQAFEAIASSSGGVQTLNGNYSNQGAKNTTIKKWKWNSNSQTDYHITIETMTPWKIVLDPPYFLP